MDEPFSGLDELTARSMRELLLGLWQETRKTALFVTHNCFEACFVADRIVVLSPRPGKVVLDLALNLDRPRREEHPAFQAGLRRLRQALGLSAALEAG
jgi:NitT/TauT family transport system ATP-binding protein